jgi:predicted nucleic acid-binding protein
VTPVQVEDFAGHEQAARDRLEAHGQSDWPLLAAALALDAHIWTKDRVVRDRVAVWATRNVRFVEGEAA